MNYLFLVENKISRQVYFIFSICLLLTNMSTGQTLKTAAANCSLNIGAAVADLPLQNDASYQNILKQEYNMVVPSNAMKMSYIKTTETGAYDFTAADRLITFAQQNGMKVRGHTILWHNQIPSWVTGKTWTKATLLSYLKDYITNVVGHFKGNITEWDVANEFIDDVNGNALRNSIWVSIIGEPVLDSAFKWVHQIDPTAKLYYNDYNAENMNSKSTAVYNLVSRLKSRGVPIHGVGFEMHKSYDEADNTTDPLVIDLDQNIKRFGALGLQVSITELDLQIPLPADSIKYAKQASSYANILDVVLDNPTIVKSFVTWGFTDKYSWISCLNQLLGNALPFDASFGKKPAYNQLLSVLQANCSGTINIPPTISLTTPASNSTVCSGASITITASASDADGTITKVDFFDGTTLLATVTASPYTYAMTNPSVGTHTLTAKATDNGNALSTATAVTITVSPLSQAPAVNTPVTYCQNATALALSATGTSLKWYSASTGGTGSATAPLPLTTTVGTTNYFVTQTTNGCESLRAMIAVTINATPGIPGATGITLCQNATTSPLTATGNSLKWYTSASGGTGSTTAPTPSSATAGTSYYYVSQTVGDCESPRVALAVTVNAAPTATIIAAGPTSIPAGGSVVLNANTGSDLTYKWFNGTSQIGTGSSYTATTAGNYTVEVTNANGCKANSSITSVNVNNNQLPTVSISAPSNNASYTAQASITIAATASDPDGTISKVEFFNSGTLIGSDASSPYSFTWTNVNAGTFNITAVATDNIGASSTSSVVTVIVNPAPNILPSISITSPQNGGTFPPTTTSVVINATASDQDGTVSKVEFYIGTSLIGTVTSAPYVFIWTGATPGTYNITAKSIDNNGGSSTSTAVSITIYANQSSIIGVTTSSNTQGNVVTINVTATDPDGTITLVEYLDGNTVIGTSTTQPFSYTWNNGIPGEHSITVRVTDSNGGVTTSDPVSVIINSSTGVQSSSAIGNFNIYPNPAKGRFYIESKTDFSDATISLLNTYGSEINVPISVSEAKGEIDVSTLDAGVYMLVIVKGESILRTQVVVFH